MMARPMSQPVDPVRCGRCGPALFGAAGVIAKEAMPSCRLCGWLMANAHTGFIVEHLDGRAERLCCGGVLRNTDEIAGISTIDVLPGVEPIRAMPAPPGIQASQAAPHPAGLCRAAGGRLGVALRRGG